MINNLPLFPLKLVVFPDENLNLHIFEPRYKQLINDCLLSGDSFGICTFLDKLMPIGTEINILEITKKYEDGRMDIKTQGIRPFKVLSFFNPWQAKQYAGGQVDFLTFSYDCDPEKKLVFETLLKEMLDLFHQDLDPVEKNLNTYTFAHKIGLKNEQEYHLLSLPTEDQRMDFLISHFRLIIPLIKEIESTKNKIKLNGHFKYLDPLNF